MQIRAKKSLGQNFLINPRILDKIVAAAEITKEDIILEVGPGMGNLTKKLAEKTNHVVAIEKDHRLISVLKEKFKNCPNVEIIESDILKFNVTSYMLYAISYKIVANIPYYITSHFLRKVFKDWPRPKLIILTIQKEVAKRIMAEPPHTNLLALSVRFYAKPKIISYISRGNFRPIPRVDSAAIKITPRENLPEVNTKKLFHLIHAGFSHKRKQLVNNLSTILKVDKNQFKILLKDLKLREETRAENLSLQDWINLNKHLKN